VLFKIKLFMIWFYSILYELLLAIRRKGKGIFDNRLANLVWRALN